MPQCSGDGQEQLTRDIKVPIDEINFVCAGINHMAFYLRFENARRRGGGSCTRASARCWKKEAHRNGTWCAMRCSNAWDTS